MCIRDRVNSWCGVKKYLQGNTIYWLVLLVLGICDLAVLLVEKIVLLVQESSYRISSRKANIDYS